VPLRHLSAFPSLFSTYKNHGARLRDVGKL